MPLALLHPPFRADQAAARECLGPEAPLARVLARLAMAVDQFAASVAVACVAAVWLAAGAPGGAEIAGAAIVVAVGLGCRAAARVSERNDLVLELIIRGEEHRSLLAVARMQRRLLDPNSQRRLARSIRSIHARSSQPPITRCLPVNARVISAVDAELEQVLGWLDAERAGASGAARAYRLVTGPGSPLYGDDLLALREELTQIRFLLGAGP